MVGKKTTPFGKKGKTDKVEAKFPDSKFPPKIKAKGNPFAKAAKMGKK